MKTYTKTELTHEAAFKLLQENNWLVEDCKFDGEGPYHRGPSSSPCGKLIGLKHGRFVQANGIGGKGWEHCWKIEEVEVDPFEEWADEYHKHFSLTDDGRFLSKSAFNAGRDYERKLHD